MVIPFPELEPEALGSGPRKDALVRQRSSQMPGTHAAHLAMPARAPDETEMGLPSEPWLSSSVSLDVLGFFVGLKPASPLPARRAAGTQ